MRLLSIKTPKNVVSLDSMILWSSIYRPIQFVTMNNYHTDSCTYYHIRQCQYDPVSLSYDPINNISYSISGMLCLLFLFFVIGHDVKNSVAIQSYFSTNPIRQTWTCHTRSYRIVWHCATPPQSSAPGPVEIGPTNTTATWIQIISYTLLTVHKLACLGKSSRFSNI